MFSLWRSCTVIAAVNDRGKQVENTVAVLRLQFAARKTCANQPPTKQVVNTVAVLRLQFAARKTSANQPAKKQVVNTEAVLQALASSGTPNVQSWGSGI